MSELADFVHPETAVVTNIGVAHLGQFKTRKILWRKNCRLHAILTKIMYFM